MEIKTTTAFGKISAIKGSVRVIQGSSGSSKTYSILQMLILIAIHHADRKLEVSIVAESVPHLKRGALNDFRNILESMGLYDDKAHNKTDSTYTLYKTKFEFFAADDAGKLRGARRDILFVNEANNISKESWRQLYMRTRLWAIIDYNPSHLGWIREVIREDRSNFISLDYRDNEYLPQPTIEYFKEQIALAESGDEDAKYFVDVYVWGREGVISGAVYKKFEEAEEVPEGAEYLGAGLDWGFSNDPTTLVKLYRYDKKIWAEEVLYQTGLVNAEIADFILADPELSEKVIWCDSASPKDIKDLQQRGVLAMAASKGAGSLLSGIKLIQSFDLVIIGKNFSKEMSHYAWRKDKNGDAMPIPIDKFNHLLDAMRYAFMEILGSGATSGHNKMRWITR